jgi:ribosomal protein S25
MRFVFGVDRLGKDVIIDESINNVLIMGNRERRKDFYSWLIGNAIVSDELDYALVSKDEKLLKNAEPYKSYSKNYVIAFEQFFNEMQRRYETLLARNIRTIDEYNRENDVKIKRLFFLVDDLDFIRDKKDALQGFIIPLLQKGRAVGIHLIIGANRRRTTYFFNAISMNCSRQFEFEEDEIDNKHHIVNIDDINIDELVDFIKERGKITISALQRKYCMGYAKAGRILDRLEEKGFIKTDEFGRKSIVEQN